MYKKQIQPLGVIRLAGGSNELPVQRRRPVRLCEDRKRGSDAHSLKRCSRLALHGDKALYRRAMLSIGKRQGRTQPEIVIFAIEGIRERYAALAKTRKRHERFGSRRIIDRCYGLESVLRSLLVRTAPSSLRHEGPSLPAFCKEREQGVRPCLGRTSLEGMYEMTTDGCRRLALEPPDDWGDGSLERQGRWDLGAKVPDAPVRMRQPTTQDLVGHVAATPGREYVVGLEPNLGTTMASFDIGSSGLFGIAPRPS
jgi:hypothetical protein